jgi:hypothetical protein
MYTRVLSNSGVAGLVEELWHIKGRRVDVVLLTNALGCSRGEGAELVCGHDKAKPEGSSEGWARKLNDPTASCMFRK